jgi:hypothetical protein
VGKVEHATHEDIDRWIDFWGNRLGLTGWTIKTIYLRRDTEAAAEMDWSEGYSSAILTISPYLFRVPSRFGAWRIICHEVLHLCFAAVADELCEQIGNRIVYKGYKRQMERAIDRLAGSLAAETPITEAPAD